jgi:hypothetical protein
MSVELSAGAYVSVEQASTADGFTKLIVPRVSSGKIAANQLPSDAPLSTLQDGQLNDGYGPVFANGIFSGLYRMELSESKTIVAISTWSTNTNGNRGAQRLTLYGSNDSKDPGWNVSDAKQFTPLGTIDTTGQEVGKFNASSLRSRKGQSLGTFRWIYWQVSPVTSIGENTAFQELHVE